MLRLHTTLLCSVALFGGNSSAATIKVPGDHATIVEAVEAASPGDTIKIAKGRYQEAIVTTKSLKFVGEKGTIWDGFFAAADHYQLAVTGADVSVDGIEFENGVIPVSISGDSATVNNCRFRATTLGIIIEGESAAVTNNVFQGTRDSGSTIRVTGGDAYIFKNHLEDGYGGSIHVFADGGGAVICKNVIETIFDEAYISLTDATGGQVIKNVIAYSNRNGVVIEIHSCDGTEVKGNTISTINKDADYGISATSGSGNEIAKNVIHNVNCSNGDIYCINVEEDDVVVSDNKITTSGAGDEDDTWGIYVQGARAVIQKNVIQDLLGGGANSFGIELFGNDASITNNEVDGLIDECTMGIVATGQRINVSKNDIRHIPSDYGIHVSALDFVVRDNTVKNCGPECNGIYVYGTASEPGAAVLEGNYVKKLGAIGITISSNGTIVQNNHVEHVANIGFLVNGASNTFVLNDARETFEDGFRVIGDFNSFSKCSARESSRDGFDIDGSSSSLNKCVAYTCVAEGFDNGGGTSTVVTKCTFKESRIDFAGANQVADDTGTKFQVGGANVMPEID